MGSVIQTEIIEKVSRHEIIGNRSKVSTIEAAVTAIRVNASVTDHRLGTVAHQQRLREDHRRGEADHAAYR